MPEPSGRELVWFRNLPQLTEPRLVGWMVRPGDLAVLAERLRQSGIACEPPRESSRQRPDGCALRWKLLRLPGERPGSQSAAMEGLLPFCIEWSAGSPHPADDAPSGLRLVQFEISRPNPDELQRTLDILGLDLRVTRSDHPQLRARIAGPQGTADLTS